MKIFLVAFISLLDTGSITKIEGNIINDKMSEITIPLLIIHPKFITGNIFENISEANPTTVVKIAKNDGESFDIIVSKTRFNLRVIWIVMD